MKTERLAKLLREAQPGPWFQDGCDVHAEDGSLVAAGLEAADAELIVFLHGLATELASRSGSKKAPQTEKCEHCNGTGQLDGHPFYGMRCPHCKRVKDYVTVTYGMRGFFAVLVDGTTHEPIQTGVGSYKTREEADIEARSWAESDGHECKLTGPTS